MTRTTWAPLEGSAQAVALEVLVNGPLSRTALASRLGLSQASLTRLTKPLLESGLLVEAEPSASEARLGRPTQPLDVIPEASHFAGVKLTEETAFGVVTTLRAGVVAERTMPLPGHDPAGVVAAVAELVAALGAEAADRGGLQGVGVSLGGNTREATVVTRAPFLGWRDVPLAELVASATGLPTVIENDVTALTEAEHWFGAGREHATFGLLTIGAGVGFGLVADRRLVTSPEAGLGLVGHHPLDPGGPRCLVGHRGCASAMLTVGGISGAVSAAVGRWVGYDEALDLAAAGDAVARAVVDDSGRALGIMVAAAANFTTAPAVVIGGEGVRLADVAAAAFAQGLASGRDPDASEVEVIVRPGDFHQWARGAAVVAIQAFVSGRPAAGRRG
ncbi:ROK family transcriptional regulator [Georgenia sp. M64]|uniref:ROK family transcriptional regulator n=1 Tax=Georgenia sp. M64 TaxID=3120520 RepID=UPI0030E1CD3F